MASWLKDSVLRPEIMGSDHCPVELFLHHEHPETKQLLLELIQLEPTQQRQLQNICSNEWPEFSSQQSTIKGFLVHSVKEKKEFQATKSTKTKPQPTLDTFFKPNTVEKKAKPFVETVQSFVMEEKKQSMELWKTLLKPPNIPKCLHEEPCKEFTVNKPGPNKGKRFYLCARPVGPEEHEEKDGKKRRLLNEFRCDYFKWKR
jgi:hypothetical protein